MPEAGGAVVVKHAKLSQIEKQGDSGRRLVEYFVVVASIERPPALEKKSGGAAQPNGRGLTTNTSDETDGSFSEWRTESSNYEEEELFADYHFRPTITARYPLHDHPDNPLHENVTFFCHPSGSIQLRSEEYMPKVHYFVATGGTGRQVYGTCLTLWEPYTLHMKPAAGQTAGVEREVYLPKCLVILSAYPFLPAFREYLTQLVRLCKTGDMTLPMERYITNFCSEIPAPPPGSFEVQTTILDSVIKIWSPPHNLPIAWVSLPFPHLFECLDVDNVILVWHCLVLERQVLITSTQLSLLTTATEIFLSLLFPFRWSHAYIPVLPHFLIPILSAPMPFLCGIIKTNLADALFDLSPECVLVDLDKNTVTLGPETTPLPPLPPYQDAALRNVLEDNAGMLFREARSLTKHDDYSESGANLPAHVKSMADAMWESKLCLFDEAFHLMFTPEESRKNILNGNDASGMDLSDRDLSSNLVVGAPDKMEGPKQSAWDAVQEAFLDTFVYLLRNYRKYLVFPSKHNEGSYGGAGFRSKEFIDYQRYDMREFLQQLIGTQMFDNFITKRLYGSGEADVAFFDLAVDRFLKNAGLFADVDLSGRFLDASGLKATNDKRGVSKARPKRTSKSNITVTKRDEDPLLQSARVHRKLKTIVPPEPTGDGLPTEISITGDDPDGVLSDDDLSVHSGSTTGSSRKRSSRRRNELPKKEVKKYMYPVFPTEFDVELFGTPRPLPAAVIAEFDRQRKDAAQFRRTGGRQPKEVTKSIHRAHSATTDATIPPSSEVATFTVFFMAFSAIVGKELVDLAHSHPDSQERLILSTYVPTTMADGGHDGDLGEPDEEPEEVVDEAEKEGVAEMKTVRPNLGGMLGDDDDEDHHQHSLAVVGKKKAVENSKASSNNHYSTEEGSEDNPITVEDVVVSSANEKVPPPPDAEVAKPRFRDKFSDFEIEEAKAKGRGQLGLAFEMLTMMKKRGLKADPEAYQCLIDACGRVGDTKRATDLLGKMHEDGIVADGTVYACLVSAFSAESAWKGGTKQEELPEWANSTAVEMDWNKLQKKSLFGKIISNVVDLDGDDDEHEEGLTPYQKLRKRILNAATTPGDNNAKTQNSKTEVKRTEFFVTEVVERQISLGENLLEIVFPDISVDTDDESCPRCNYNLSDDDVVAGWTPGDSNDYTTACPNCTQRFVPHFCVECSATGFVGSRGPSTPLMCERLSPWVLQKEIRSVMSDREGIENLISPAWREQELKNAVLWWNLVLSCMRYRFPFTFLLQGSFEQNLIAPTPEDDS